MHLGPDAARLDYALIKRDPSDEASRNRTIFLSVSAGAVVFLAAVLLTYSFLGRRIGTYSPAGRWQLWNKRNKSYGQVASHDRAHSLNNVPTAYSRASVVDETTPNDEPAAPSTNTAPPNRNVSVRSTISLPAYSEAPKNTEQVIGREGERAGMDTVVEFPETNDEEESRREEEMGSLYQIRLQRRREIVEREQRRQERRDARDARDWDRLQELRNQSRLRADLENNGSSTDVSAATMLAEHQSRGRDRRVSSVSYAEVGLARHDGSRVRANSQDSERGGLLDGAASMGESRGHHRAGSGSSSFFSAIPRPRDRSVSSMSISTAASDVDVAIPSQMTPPSPYEAGRTNTGIHRRSPLSGEFSVDHRTSDSSPTATRFTPQESSGSDDIGDSHIPPPDPGPSSSTEPPLYQAEWDDAPAYQSPTYDRGHIPASGLQSRPTGNDPSPIPSRGDGGPTRIPSKAPKLPMIDTLPSINVEGATEPNTPASPVGHSDEGTIR